MLDEPYPMVFLCHKQHSSAPLGLALSLSVGALLCHGCLFEGGY